QFSSPSIRTRRKDILIRIAAATSLVFGITQTAPALGSHLNTSNTKKIGSSFMKSFLIPMNHPSH
ncbi:MAG: hypothetical protein M1368_03710, partial [Thaumarchaeota archaeon]|nr:hypothetical protein [Nitrososphaerota archaeon]